MSESNTSKDSCSITTLMPAYPDELLTGRIYFLKMENKCRFYPRRFHVTGTGPPDGIFRLILFGIIHGSLNISKVSKAIDIKIIVQFPIH